VIVAIEASDAGCAILGEDTQPFAATASEVDDAGGRHESADERRDDAGGFEGAAAPTVEELAVIVLGSRFAHG
jgi:hypothetical protein